jgi:hypothetical protein
MRDRSLSPLRSALTGYAAVAAILALQASAALLLRWLARGDYKLFLTISVVVDALLLSLGLYWGFGIGGLLGMLTLGAIATFFIYDYVS